MRSRILASSLALSLSAFADPMWNSFSGLYTHTPPHSSSPSGVRATKRKAAKLKARTRAKKLRHFK